MTTAPAFHRRSAARCGSTALWIAALVFLFQLLAATHHDHEVAAKSQHCVSCALHAQPHAAPPEPLLRIAPSGLALLQVLPAVAVVDRAVPPPRYLLPLPHAPPPFPRFA